MGTSVTAATFDDALRGCIDEEYPGKAPIQAFPLDPEAAATVEGPPECEYRVPIGRPGATEGEEERIVILDAESEGNAWTFTFEREEEADEA
jgi:hypothetical protein